MVLWWYGVGREISSFKGSVCIVSGNVACNKEAVHCQHKSAKLRMISCNHRIFKKFKTF